MAESHIKATMEFPTRSAATTDETFTWDEVKTILDKENMRRAEYVTRIILTLKERFGDEVMDIARQTIYQIGYEKGQARAALVARQKQEKNLASLAELIAHRVSRLYYGTVREVTGNQLVVRETYCPLPRKWKDMGFSDDEIVQLCLLFDQVDKGMVEGYSEDFEAELTGCQGLAERGYCQMTVRSR